MSVEKVKVIVERQPDRQIAEALLAPYAVEIVDGFTMSGAIGTAEYSLLTHPERSVAVLFDSMTTDKVEIAREIRGPTMRILARAYPLNWYVAIAIPRLDAWAQTDPRIAQGLRPVLERTNLYTEIAARIAELTKSKPFDPTELRKVSADFNGLVEFIQKHTSAPAKGADAAARR